MLYVRYNREMQMNTHKKHNWEFQVIPKQDILLLIVLGPLCTLQLVIKNHRLRVATLKIYDKYERSIKASITEPLNILSIGVNNINLESRPEAVKVANLLSYLTRKKDSDAINDFMQLFPWIRTVQNQARARAKKNNLNGKNLDSLYSMNIASCIQDGAVLEFDDVLKAIYNGTSLNKRSSMSEQFYAAINFYGLLMSLDEGVRALDGVFAMMTQQILTSLELFAFNLYRSEISDYNSSIAKRKKDEHGKLQDHLPWKLNKSSRYAAILDTNNQAPEVQLLNATIQR